MNTRKCCGHKGHWYCADKYPDHILPVSEFNKNGDKLQGFCRTCQRLTNKMQEDIKPRHPITGERKKNWKRRYALSLGGKPKAPDWQSYLDRSEGQWHIELGQFIAVAPTETIKGAPVYRTHRKLSKVDRPKSIRVTTKKVVDSRGYVYIFKDHMKSDGLYKIGASHAPQERLDQANTWGDFESIYESEEVTDCAKLEKEVHQYLRKYQAKGEWFKVSEDTAINTIKELVNESFNHVVAS